MKHVLHTHTKRYTWIIQLYVVFLSNNYCIHIALDWIAPCIQTWWGWKLVLTVECHSGFIIYNNL